jgi:hypothetical protein
MVPSSPKSPHPLSVAINQTSTTNNTLPVSLKNTTNVTVNSNAIQSEQNSTNTFPMSSVQDIRNNTASFSCTSVPNTNNSIKKLILLHHQENASCILSDFCLTRSKNNTADMNVCKYGAANLMVVKSQVQTSGSPCLKLSPSVFIPTSGLLK